MTIECPPVVSYRYCGEMLNVKSVVIKCPFAFFAQICPREARGSGWDTRFLAGIQWVPVALWEGANISECLG